MIHFVDTLPTFVAKIKNLTSKVTSGNFAMFEKFSEVIEGGKKEETEFCLQNATMSPSKWLPRILQVLAWS